MVAGGRRGAELAGEQVRGEELEPDSSGDSGEVRQVMPSPVV